MIQYIHIQRYPDVKHRARVTYSAFFKVKTTTQDISGSVVLFRRISILRL